MDAQTLVDDFFTHTNRLGDTISSWQDSKTSALITTRIVLEVLNQDYIRTARAKGLADRLIIMRHALKNASLPFVTLIGLELPFLPEKSLHHVSQWYLAHWLLPHGDQQK